MLLDNLKFVGRNYGMLANTAGLGFSIAIDAYDNRDNFYSTKTAADIGTDVAIGLGTIKLCTAIGSCGGPLGMAGGFVIGLGINYCLDGPNNEDGKTWRTKIQGYVKEVLDCIIANWNLSPIDTKGNYKNSY